MIKKKFIGAIIVFFEFIQSLKGIEQSCAAAAAYSPMQHQHAHMDNKADSTFMSCTLHDAQSTLPPTYEQLYGTSNTPKFVNDPLSSSLQNPLASPQSTAYQAQTADPKDKSCLAAHSDNADNQNHTKFQPSFHVPLPSPAVYREDSAALSSQNMADRNTERTKRTSSIINSGTSADNITPGAITENPSASATDAYYNQFSKYFVPFQLNSIQFPGAPGEQECLKKANNFAVFRSIKSFNTLSNDRLHELDKDVLYDEQSTFQGYNKDRVALKVSIRVLKKIYQAIMSVATCPWFFHNYICQRDEIVTTSYRLQHTFASINDSGKTEVNVDRDYYSTKLPSGDSDVLKWGLKTNKITDDNDQKLMIDDKIHHLDIIVNQVITQLNKILEILFWTSNSFGDLDYNAAIRLTHNKYIEYGNKLDEAKCHGHDTRPYERGIKDALFRKQSYKLVWSIYSGFNELSGSDLSHFTSDYYFHVFEKVIPGFYKRLHPNKTQRLINKYLLA